MTNTFASEAAAETSKPVIAEQPEPSKEKPLARQIVSFQFFKVMPEWRRLPAEQRAAHKRAFAEVIERWNQPDRLRTITYSTIGTRSDCEMFLWRICNSVDDINQMTAELLATPLGGYLETAHSFLAMTKRSQYLIGHEHEGQADSRGFLRPGLQKYIFVYPFWKTRAWYLLPKDERQRLMSEHIRVGHLYPRVKLNTTYSFGLDDQEFVVAFETNYPEDFLDLVEQLRGTEISAYTLKDFPIFTCVRMSPEEMLDRIG
ncbi:MAG: chlorite dismutase family protein [Acidobacteriaceae bacterium]